MTKYMVKEGIGSYIKNQLKAGYNINSIRSSLLKSGYSNAQINKAINSAYSKNKLSPRLVLLIVGMIITITALFFLLSYLSNNNSNKRLEYNIISDYRDAKSGEEIFFTKKLTNFNEKKEITIKHDIINVKEAKTITSEEESGILGEVSQQSSILVPEDTPSGNYVIRSTAIQGDKKKIGTLTIKVKQEKKQEEEINETGILECPDCNDNDPCTEEFCSETTKFRCVYERISSCNEDNNTEEMNTTDVETENEQQQDNNTTDIIEQEGEEEEQTETEDSNQKIKEQVDLIKEKALQDINFVKSCNQFEEQLEKDYCYSSIAVAINDSNTCSNVIETQKKDDCYMEIMMMNNHFSLCGNLTDTNLKESCMSLYQE